MAVIRSVIRGVGAYLPKRRLTNADLSKIVDTSDDVLTFRRGPITVVLNCGAAPVELPEGEVLLSSGPVDGKLPADTAVWIR